MMIEEFRLKKAVADSLSGENGRRKGDPDDCGWKFVRILMKKLASCTKKRIRKLKYKTLVGSFNFDLNLEANSKF